ncbi:MAG: hypothetical protein J7497_15800, partial [Chitinophagaceae bacterium]|nr:hypothetical protein [Chitinophagaceae bacterium]
MKVRALLIVLLLITFFTNVSGQEYSYTRYDVKDGLTGSVVYHGVEDKDGFLWFATETGVSRFDGTHFKNFTKKDGLPDNEILKLFVDSKGRVWMMPFRNALCYYWKGKIYNTENDHLLNKLSLADRIIDIVEDQQGNFTFICPAAFYLVNAQQDIQKITTVENKQFIVGGTGLNAAGHVMAYIVTNHEVHFIEVDKQGTVLKKALITNDDFNILTRQSTYLSDHLQIHKEKDSLIITTNAGKTRSTLALPHTFNNLSVINDSLYVLNTGTGSLFYNIKTGKVIRQALPGIIVNSALRDSEGNWWFLTGGVGIYRVGSFEFNNYTFSENNKTYRSVFSICKTDSVLYAGTENALLFTIDFMRQTIRHQYVFAKPMNTRIL